MRVMPIDDTDREILEYLSVEEPWHILCGELIDEAGEPRDLPERVERLWRAGAIAIRKRCGTQEEPTAENLRNDAERNDWHSGEKVRDQPWWDLLATEKAGQMLGDGAVG